MSCFTSKLCLNIVKGGTIIEELLLDSIPASHVLNGKQIFDWAIILFHFFSPVGCHPQDLTSHHLSHTATMDVFWTLPPVSRTIAAAAVVVSALGYARIINLAQYIYIAQYVFTVSAFP